MSFILRLTIAVLIFFGIEFYFYKKVKNILSSVFPNFNTKTIKRILRTYFAITNIYPAILVVYWVYLMVSGEGRSSGIENHFWDWLVVYPFWISALITLQTIIFFFPIDLFRLILFPLYKKHKDKVRKIVYLVNFVILLAAFIYVPARVVYDYNSVSTRITSLEVENLPKDLQNFKITFISDTQADWYTDDDRLSNFINKVNQTNPDLILMAGDVITGTPNYIDVAAEALGKLKAPNGVYSCVGDHDNWAYRQDNARSLREITTALGHEKIEMVDNANKIIRVDSSTIKISFATYTYSRRINEAGLEKLAEGNMKHDVDIFLTHQPNEFMVDFANEANYDLYLAGHTHGGQLTLFFPFYNLTPTLMETKYVKGDFFLGNMKIIVTRGLGMSIAPIRYNSAPEITTIILQNKD